MNILHVLKRREAIKKRRLSSHHFLRRFSIFRRKLGGQARIVFKSIFRNKVFTLTLSLSLISLSIILGRYFLFSDTFDIREVRIIGYEHLQSSFFDERLQYLLGQNIFFVRSSSLRTDVEQLSPYIYEVRVEKRLPDKIFIDIEERNPQLVWVNLAGAYLIDEEGVVLEVVSDFENLTLDGTDIDLLKGYGDLTTLKKGTDEDGAEGEESEVNSGEDKKKKSMELTPEEKNELIESQRKELIARVDTYWETKLNDLDPKYKLYPTVYSYEINDYKVLDKFNGGLYETTKVGIQIDFLGEDISKFVWESEFRFVIYMGGWKRIAFSTKRDFKEQVEDLRVLLDDFNSKGKEFSYIDLGSELILYELD